MLVYTDRTFSAWALVTFGTGSSLWWVSFCALQDIFNSILGLHPLDDSSLPTPAMTKESPCHHRQSKYSGGRPSSLVRGEVLTLSGTKS